MSKFKKHKNIIIIAFLMIIIVSILLFLILNKKLFSSNKNEKKEDTKVVEEKKLTIVDEDSNTRPIAVMIDNNVGNSSQAGLQESYINYEIIVEGGLTRIMAIFKDKDVSLIGPVRSSRHYFLDYALESDSIYAHYGWSTYAQNDIKNLGVDNINGLYDEAPFWRDTKISAPHNVFTSTKELYLYALEKKYSLKSNSWKLLNYTTDEVNLNEEVKKKSSENSGQNEEVLVAEKIVIPYSYYQSRSYQYDSNRKVYLRFMNNSIHVDKITGEQLFYKNIIIEKVSNISLDSYGRQDLDTATTGNGYYITNGYALPIIWTKDERSAKTIYTYKDGSKVKFNDGNTFIQIEPENYKPTIE